MTNSSPTRPKHFQRSHLIWAIKILLAFFIASILLRGLFESIFPRDYTMEYYSYIKNDLQNRDFNGYSTFEVIREQPFQIVALSDMAIGIMNLDKTQRVPRDELLPLIEEVKRRALHPKVRTYNEITPETDFTTGGIDGLYLSHLNLILGIDQYLHVTAPDPLQTSITKVLHDRSLSEPDFHVPSFRHGDKWPADQAVTLLSLYVYDQVNHTMYSNEPIEKWLNYLHQHKVDAETGLYKSSIAQRWYMDIPRGTAQSWMIFYLAQFAPAEAEKLYANYRNVMWQEFLGIGGFREWPANRGGRATIDSGPIVLGIGSAASALGVGATRLFNDTHHYTLIMRLFSLLEIPHYAPLIGRAILFSGSTAVLWFGEYQPNGYDLSPASPIIFYGMYIAVSIGIILTILFFDVVIAHLLTRSRARKVDVKTELFRLSANIKKIVLSIFNKQHSNAQRD